MLSDRAKAFLDDIRLQIPSCVNLEEAVKRVRSKYETLLSGSLPEELEAALQDAKNYYSDRNKPVEILQKRSILEPHTPWYSGSQDNDRLWPALRKYIAESKGWGEETADNIGEAADEVVSLLADPMRPKFLYRGLVVGYVQSGKTANMTSVIAKAVDAGYNFIVILAGLTNTLRQQTQRRMVSDLVNRYQDDWYQWTNTEDKGDFKRPQGNQFVGTPGTTQLSVLKKNVSPLRQFLSTLESTPAAVINDFRVLILDDECDSASVNASSKEYDITAINELIRKIIKTIPAVSYVGYTATPFANVLINPYTHNSQFEDLYPKNFITCLDRPKGYFGTQQLFGLEPVDADDIKEDEEGLDMIRLVPDHELEYLRTPSRKEKDNFYPIVTESLEDAIMYFIASCAARYARGQSEEHMTMLVHTSVYSILHDRMSGVIETWLNKVKKQLNSKTGELFERCKRIWESELDRVPDNITEEEKISFEALLPRIPEVLDKIETPVENADSDNRLDYETDSKIYIVVGGTVLARGLTLEGLMVSFFLRTTSQYDTLLQMGRWFGYRKGYEDLPRIWMTDDLSTSFRKLATVENEIRDEIKIYRERKVSPMEFAVRIRSFPGMAITAANKMRNAIQCDISYSGQHRQTIRFSHTDKNILNENWNAAAELLSYADQLATKSDVEDKILYKGVDVTQVRRFFQKYSVHPDHQELSSDLLIKYINGLSEIFGHWNIGLFQPKLGKESQKPMGKLGAPRLVNRAAIKDTNEESVDIKALMSTKDVIFDCEIQVPDDINKDWKSLKKWRQKTVGQVPLLLLYVIDKDSSPMNNSKYRTDLNASDHIVGFGIIFPEIKDNSGNYVSVSLDEPSADDIESLDEEIDEHAGSTQ
jgi:hypothetical protein